MPLLLPDVNVLPSHLHAAASVDLQTNHAIGEFRRGVIVIRNLKAIQMNYDVIAANRGLKVIPLAWLQRPLALGRRHDHPASASAFVKSAGVFAYAGIDLHLHPLDVRTVLRVDAGNARMEK